MSSGRGVLTPAAFGVLGPSATLDLDIDEESSGDSWQEMLELEAEAARCAWVCSQARARQRRFDHERRSARHARRLEARAHYDRKRGGHASSVGRSHDDPFSSTPRPRSRSRSRTRAPQMTVCIGSIVVNNGRHSTSADARSSLRWNSPEGSHA